jgi:hypothetical protein
MPLLGGRFAATADVSHSTLGETGFGASLNGRVAGSLRLGGAYHATRLDDVDRLAHQGRVTVSMPVLVGKLDVCPLASGGYARLTTERSSTQGRVATREFRLGATVGHGFAVARGMQLTPFVEPVLVRRNVLWESIDAWTVDGETAAREGQVWLGASLSTPRSGFVMRYRPKTGSGPHELALGFVTAFGRR